MTSKTGWSRKHAVATTRALPLLLLICFAVPAKPQASPLIDDQVQQPYRISVNLDLVVLQATVRDRKGRFASDLRAQDFEVYEDGVRQSIRLFRHEDIPVTAGLVIDHSGSMRRKLPDVIIAARTFVQFSSPEDEMFVVNFNDSVTLGLPAAIRFTNRPDDLARAISNIPATGKTALYDAVVASLEQLQAGSRNKKALIVVSDGGDNASTHRMAEALKLADQSGALVYAIGIFDDKDPDWKPAVLRRLARSTGGEAFFTSQLNEVAAICERIARDIRHQYTIGYVSSNRAKPGAWHPVRVVARPTGKVKLFVRTRSGYIAADESRPTREDGTK